MINPSLNFYFFIEALMVALVGGFVFKWQSKSPVSYIKYSISYGLTIYLVRSIFLYYKLPIPTNVIPCMIISVILMKSIFKESSLSSLGATLVSMILLIFGEAIIAPNVMNIFHWSSEIIQNNPIKYIILGLINLVPMYLLVIFFMIKKGKMFGQSLSKNSKYFGSIIK